jgi:hypothetical protein
VKDGLDTTGKKNRLKTAKIACMHWNMPPDTLPGSAIIGPLA